MAIAHSSSRRGDQGELVHKYECVLIGRMKLDGFGLMLIVKFKHVGMNLMMLKFGKSSAIFLSPFSINRSKYICIQGGIPLIRVIF